MSLSGRRMSLSARRKSQKSLSARRKSPQGRKAPNGLLKSRHDRPGVGVRCVGLAGSPG